MESDCERDLSHSVAVADVQMKNAISNIWQSQIKVIKKLSLSTVISAAILASFDSQLAIGPCAFLHLDLASW